MSVVSTAAEVSQALSTTGNVSLEINQNIDLTSGDISSFVIGSGVSATVTIREGVTVVGNNGIFRVENAHLFLVVLVLLELLLKNLMLLFMYLELILNLLLMELQ